MNTRNAHQGGKDMERYREQLEAARALAMKLVGDDSTLDLADLYFRIDQIEAAASADRQFEDLLRDTIKDDLERAEEMAIRDTVIADLNTFIRQTMTTDQVLGVQAFVMALNTGATSPEFFRLMADSFQARRASK